MFYIITILGAMALIILGNWPCFGFSAAALGYLSLATALCTVAVIAVDGVAALIVRRLLPSRWFMPGTRLFAVSKKERDLYRRLGIKTWKDKVPELGMFTAFSKSHLDRPEDPKYLARFIMESHYGVICHVAGAAVGFLICLIPYWSGSLLPGRVGVWLPVACVNFVLSLLPVAILRFTAYTLEKMYQRKMREPKKENQNISPEFSQIG